MTQALSKLSPAIPTRVFDTYWSFAAERQAIFFRKILLPSAQNWTQDSILRKYKFTNVYRASDRVSQYLIRNISYAGDQSPEELFFRTILFKIFNSINTWELLQKEVGGLTYRDYSFKLYDQVLTDALTRGERVYSGAYIMPSGNKIFGHTRKHRNHLKMLERMMDDEVALRIASAHSMKSAFELLRSYPLIGDFLAYQYVTDLNYSRLTDFNEAEFVAPGPGALEGIRKCFSSLGGLTPANIIRYVMDSQEEEFSERGLQFKNLWGRPLKLIDCQNLFCEVDKYSRIAHPEFTGVSGRSRIKQHYRHNENALKYWYPPKWKLNGKIRSDGNK